MIRTTSVLGLSLLCALLSGPFVSAISRHANIILDAEDLAPMATVDDSTWHSNQRSLLQVYPPYPPPPPPPPSPPSPPPPAGQAAAPRRPVRNANAPEPNERSVRAGISASSEEAATTLANDVNEFVQQFSLPYTPTANGNSRKILAAEDAKRMIDRLLANAVENSEATSARLVSFEREDGTNNFNIDIILGYPESASAAEMDADAENTDNVSRALTSAVSDDETYASQLDTDSVSVTVTRVKKYTAPETDYSSERDVTIDIRTKPDGSLVVAMERALNNYFGDSSEGSADVIGNVKDALEDLLQDVEAGAVLDFVEFERDGNLFSLLLRLAFPPELSADEMNASGRQFISDAEAALEQEARRKLLVPAVLVQACGGDAEECIFEDATFVPPIRPTVVGDADLEGWSGAAAVRVLASGLLLTVAAFVFLA